MEIELNRLVNALPGLVWTALPDGRAEYLGSGWLEYTGLRADEATGHGWQTAVHPEDLPRLQAEWVAIIESGQPGEVEARLRRFDGAYRWFLFRARPMPDPSGQVTRWCGINFDIEDRVQAEAAAREHQSRFERLIDALPGLVWTTKPDGTSDFINQRWSEYAGLSLEEVRGGQGWKSAIHPEDMRHAQERWDEILAAGVAGEVEARLRRFDGEYRHFNIKTCPLRDASGAIVGWCGINTDIEDRRRAEDAVLAFERRFQFIFEGLPAMVTLMTREGEFERGNQYMLDYFGKTFEELKTRSVGFSFHPEDRPEVMSRWRRSVETGAPYDHEARLRRADGVYRWFHTRGFPLRDAEGRISVWYLLQEDIDERRRAQALLAGEKLLLEKVARGLPLSSILHDLSHRVEELVQGSCCSILLVDGGGERFRVASGPSLPDSYNAVLDGKTIDPNYEPCSLAVATKAPVITADLANDPRWASSNWPPLVAEHGLVSCWSMPILAAGQQVLGILAIYRREPVGPTASEQELIDRFTRIAGIAIERAQGDAALTANEAELRRAYRQLTEAQRLSRTGSFTADIAADEHIWSEELFPIFEFEPGTRISLQRVLELLHPEDLPEFEAAFGRALSGASDFEHGFRILTPGGRLKHLHCVAHHLQTQDGPVFVGAIQDVTQSKTDEQALKANDEALRASEAELRRAYAHLTTAQRLSRTGSFTWDVQDDEHNWSEEIYRIFGLELGSKVTMAVIQGAIHPEDAPTVEAVIGGALAGAGFDFVFRLVVGSGLRHVHVVGRRMEQIQDRIVFVGAIQDITESKVAEESLNRARAELAHVSRVTALGALTASIAHEVNQPLAGIITNASTCLRMLAADPPNLEGARATAQRTIRDGNRASEVIQRLRALFARTPPGKAPVDLNEAVREVLALSSSELQRRRVIVRTDLPDDLPPVRGDRVQLQQVILNLVLNAADAMSAVDDRPRDLSLTTALDASGQIALTVRDSGVGIPPEGLGRLFDAFYTTKSEGMGIGLSISRSIIESHEGRLWATANDGPGATFSFSIPCQTESISGGEDPDTPTAPAKGAATSVLREA